MNHVELDYSSREKILHKITQYPGEPEMSEFQSAFLCGLLKEKRPKKILEIGVAGGATTAIMLQRLVDNKRDFKMYSVDWSEKFYRGKHGEKTGFLAMEAVQTLSIDNMAYELLTGHCLPYYKDVYGGDIDFVMMDTAHSLPGEVLDFLCILPHLKKDAVVCLHDVDANFKNPMGMANIACNLLFYSVVADKFYMYDNMNGKRHPSNIGAFKINGDTMRYVENVFGMLFVNWSYLPEREDLRLYEEQIKMNYPDGLYKAFRTACESNYNGKSTWDNRLRKMAKIFLKGKI